MLYHKVNNLTTLVYNSQSSQSLSTAHIFPYKSAVADHANIHLAI